VTQLRDLPAERLALNPDAPQPPFPVWMALPADWTLLDTNPATWRRSAEEMIDTTFRSSRLRGPERREVMQFFEQLVADVQRAGAALSIIQVGRREAGGAASVGIHLAFADEGRPSSLARVRDSLPRTGTSTEIASSVGPAVLQRDRMTMIPPGATEVVALTSMQVFIPIPDTTWTALFSTATAFPELTEPIEQLMRQIAAQFRLTEAQVASEPNGAAGHEGAVTEHSTPQAEYRPAPRPTGPGIERGFGTFVTKRTNGAVPADE
jgi:hypothetical protein